MRTQTAVTFVANQALSTPLSPYIKRVQVLAGFDVADAKILTLMQRGDLVITADIPLASQVIAQGGLALNPRGTLYSERNMEYYLALRNHNESRRESGSQTSGPAKLTARDNECFANQLDTLLRTSA